MHMKFLNGLKKSWKISNTKMEFSQNLINKEGKVEDTFSSLTKPMSQKIISKINKMIN